MIRKKILLISSWYPIRKKPTLGNFVFKHAEAAAHFHDIFALHIALDNNMDSAVEEDFQVHPFSSRIIYLKETRIPLLGRLIDRFRIVKQYGKEIERLLKEGFKPDLVHANVVYPIGFIAWYFKIRYKIDYILSEHWTGYHDYAFPRPGFLQKSLIRFIANHARLIMPDSVDLGNAMRKWGIDTDIQAVANVVNTIIFRPAGDKNETSKIKIIHISTLDPDQKNIHLLLNGFKRFLTSHPHSELHIVTDGDLDFYRETIKELNIAGKIINHGRLDVTGVAATLKSCDFFILTSNFENLPCVLIEAIACGVPVISTDVGGVTEIVNLNNGMVVPPDNLDELVKAMEQMAVKFKMYDKNQMHLEAMEKYSYEAIGQQLAGIYSLYATQ
jgi:glycosyltransferase involved in cell wall biosynthesis